MVAPSVDEQLFTSSEVATRFRCSARKVTDLARDNQIGVYVGGPAGYRFTEQDVLLLWEAMRPKPAAAKKDRKRRRVTAAPSG